MPKPTSMARKARTTPMLRPPIRMPRLCRKETKLCFIGHGLMKNRHGLLVDACLTLADGHAERVAALHMIEPRADRPTAITLGANKACDAEDFVNELRSMNVTSHVRRTPAAAALRSTGERPARRLYHQPAYPQAHRGRIRLDQDGRRTKNGPASVAVSASDGSLPLLLPPTIWCGCPS